MVSTSEMLANAPTPSGSSTNDVPTLPSHLLEPIDVFMIDNFDSFTWNLYQSLCLLGARVTVVRNDFVPIQHAARLFAQMKIGRLIISPGPGNPKDDAGVCEEAIKYWAGKVPILGVCMGLEVIVNTYGGDIAYAGEIMHGKLSPLTHDNRGIFRGLPQNFMVTRYHSLSAAHSTLPSCLAPTAASDTGVIMGVRHRTLAIAAVQYHPESVVCEQGDALLRNFLKLNGGEWRNNPEYGVDAGLPPFPVEVLAPSQAVNGSAGKLGTNGSAVAKAAPSILDRIYAQRAQDIVDAKLVPGHAPAFLRAQIARGASPALIDFPARLAQSKPALMAEIKRASPSKGDIAPGADAGAQALAYALAGAAVISVLTEPTWFKGTLADLRAARLAVSHLPNRPAILRKEFILDEYQIDEARLAGADTVLLIVAMLPPHRLQALYDYSRSLGMEPLVEVNNAAEMKAACKLGAKVVGVNNRNLHSFDVDMSTTGRLAAHAPPGSILCALSGITGPADVRAFARQGVGAVLVGESLMRAKDTAAFIHELLGTPKPPPTPAYKPLVKICGIRNKEEALAASQAGADMLGLVFAPKSKRVVSTQAALEISLAIRTLRSSPEAPTPSPLIPRPKDSQNLPWFASHATRLAASKGRPLLVGVFQGQTLSEILDAVEGAQLDMVQLHGREPPEWALHIPVPVVRAFHVETPSSPQPNGSAESNGASEKAKESGLRDVSCPGLHKFVLLDAMRPDSTGLSGGGGKVLDLDLAQRIVRAGELAPRVVSFDASQASNGTGQEEREGSALPIILAGGLTPENVGSVVEKVSPWAVDVSGGVENADGTGKDLEKVAAFVKAVKG
ncbi:phosphoribosyl anthranilate isomerase [Coniophora puteana RWD-64-598 SS2]|uniref:Multifunctional tryptophan biosynthesis protein n=1 Tax=Coniophora puteana (strain RWD-64-598) TaxID=741705 RepID=A0A5M3MP58_CONPW|nr:phosphoribosyl anthranilate isomerase [Coniophora puteana RWD-64-598 SS2]EIW80827.1 phosphoribosyl anthranilate isomerase [Coniophora puteana RWD-64-598 SS2]